MRKLAYISLALLLLFGCKKEITNPGDDIFIPPQDSFLIMSYNVFAGAGTTPATAELREQNECLPNGLDELIELINFYDPDIIGLQEAYAWQANNHYIANLLADTLNMNYLLAPGSLPENNIMLLTKYEITDFEYYTSRFKGGALSAELNFKDKETIKVYVFHIWHEPGNELIEFNGFYKSFEDTTNGILMGEFIQNPENIYIPDNWRILANSFVYNQIWSTENIGLSKSGKYFGYPLSINQDDLSFDIDQLSDYLPVLYRTGLYFDEE